MEFYLGDSIVGAVPDIIAKPPKNSKTTRDAIARDSGLILMHHTSTLAFSSLIWTVGGKPAWDWTHLISLAVIPIE